MKLPPTTGIDDVVRMLNNDGVPCTLNDWVQDERNKFSLQLPNKVMLVFRFIPPKRDAFVTFGGTGAKELRARFYRLFREYDPTVYFTPSGRNEVPRPETVKSNIVADPVVPGPFQYIYQESMSLDTSGQDWIPEETAVMTTEGNLG